MEILNIIEKKRDGKKLTHEELEFVITNYTNSNIADYQMSALLMAIYLKGMDDEEASMLALIMAKSGEMLDLSKIDGIKVDKHSTGGVGDKVTLVLAPLLASCGAKFAKMSGRGLGHTGGTVDKLEAIPNFRVELSKDEFVNQVNNIGLAVVGQSGDIAPADKKIYALRDVTATVDCNALIASSIMSKKLASGANCICLDIKVGNGAFMKDVKSATTLANLMISIGRSQNRKVSAILTNMDEPLGHMIGNSLEVYEAVKTLQNKGPKDLLEICLQIGSQLLVDSNIAKTHDMAYNMLLDNIKNNKAYNKFIDMVKSQGGDISYIENVDKLINSKTYSYKSKTDGYISEFDTVKLGEAARLLGAGRLTKEDIIDYFTGFNLIKKIGDKVKKGDEIITIYHNDKGLNECIKLLDEAISYSLDKPKLPTLVEGFIR